jgi:two-component system chemotaxis response regulator CheB
MTADHDIIVIGGSAGALEALRIVVRSLPSDLPASVFVVIHSGSKARSYIREILTRDSRLGVTQASDHGAIQPGQIYVAAPDHHLLVKDGIMRVMRGPRENGFRPAIDPLFRTAARAYGNRVVGVLLSGELDDGTYGLMQIKKAGGKTIVQQPDEALAPSMPQSALRNLDVDYVLCAADIAALLVDLGRSPEESLVKSAKEGGPDVAEGLSDILRADNLSEPPSGFTCPECGGALWEVREGEMLRYLCHVGHGYTSEALLSEHSERVERALWSAVRILEENASINRRMAKAMDDKGVERSKERFEDYAIEREQNANVLREILTGVPIPHEPDASEEIAEHIRSDYESPSE